ncbi:MAG: amino acid ABC transporter permease [Solirubrobacteraceae bacterium]
MPIHPPIAFFDILTENFDAFASGFWVTVKIVAISFVIAMVVGTLVAAFRVAPNKPLQRVGGLYVEFFRNIPLLVLVFISFPGLRRAGVDISAIVAGVASLGLYTAAYVAEALRSGVFSVSQGQIEASLSLGFSYPETLRRIVLPQAFRTVISPLGSLIIAMIKNSAILGGSILALDDLLKTGRVISSRTFETVPSFVWAASGYLILTGLATLAIRHLETRYAVRR